MYVEKCDGKPVMKVINFSVLRYILLVEQNVSPFVQLTFIFLLISSRFLSVVFYFTRK